MAIKVSDIQFDDDQKKKPAALSAQDFTFEPSPKSLKSIYRETSERDPNQVAEVNRISRKLDADPLAVSEDLPQAKRAAAAPDFQEITRSAPVLAEKMQDPNFMSVSHDDKTLVQTEQAFADYAAGRKGNRQDVLGIATPSGTNEAQTLKSEYVSKPAQSVVASAGQFASMLAFPVAGLADKLLGGGYNQEALSQSIDAFTQQKRDAAPGPSVGGVGKFVRGIEELIPLLATGPGAVPLIAGEATTSAAVDLIDQGVDPNVAASLGAMSGVVAVAITQIPFAGKNIIQSLVRGTTISPAIGIINRAAQKGVLTATDYDKIAKNIGITDPGALAQDLAMGVLFGLHGSMGKPLTGESFAETAIPFFDAVKQSNWYRTKTIKERGLVAQSLEEAIQRSGKTEAELAKMSASYKEQALKRRMQPDQSQVDGSPIPARASPVAAASTRVNTSSPEQKKEQIAQQEEFIDKIANLGTKSELKKRDPNVSYADFMGALAKKNGIESVYLQAGRAVQEMSNQGMSSKEITDWFKQYDVSIDNLVASVESGGFVELPTGRVIAKIGDDVVLNQLRSHLSQDPTGPSAATIDEDLADSAASDQHLQDIDELDRQAGLEQTDVDFIDQQLQEAGRTPEQSAIDAQVIAAIAKTRGQKLGMTARQFIEERWGLTFQAAQRTYDDTPLNKRFKESDANGRDLKISSAETKIADLEKQIAPYIDGTYTDLSEEETARVDGLKQHLSTVKQELADYDSIQEEEKNSFEQSVFHGTPHRFDKFSLEAMDTGEGVQAYGWGLYFAGDKGVAEWYRDTLSSGRVNDYDKISEKVWESGDWFGDINKYSMPQLNEVVRDMDLDVSMFGDEATDEDVLSFAAKILDELSNQGNLYQVEIPEDGELLLWDSSLEDQPAAVKAALEGILPEYRIDNIGYLRVGDKMIQGSDKDAIDGRDIYMLLKMQEGSAQAASEYLNSLGIKGIKYADGNSRGNFANVPISQERRDEITARLNALQKEEMPTAKDGATLKVLNDEMAALSTELAEADADPQSFNFVIFDSEVVTVEAVNDELVQAQQLEKTGELPDETFFQSLKVEQSSVNEPPVPLAKRTKTKTTKTDQLALDFSAEEKRPEGPKAKVAYLRPTGKPAMPSPIAAELKQVVDQVQTGTFKSGLETVNSSEEAAHVLSSIRKQAREQFLILVLDKDKAPIGIVDVSAGSVNASIVHPREALGAALNVPGVDSIWMAHNHPSGVTAPSAEDIALTSRLKNILDATGTKMAGHIILGESGAFQDIVNYTEGKATPAVRKLEVPVYGMPVFRGRVSASSEKVSDSSSAARIFSDKPDGIMVLNSKNIPVAFVPMAAKDMDRLRTGDNETGAALITRTAQQTAGAVLLVHLVADASRTGEETYAIGSNMAAFGNAIGVRTLDVITTGKDSTGKDFFNSLADKGQLGLADNFFQDSDGGPLAAISFNTARTKATIGIFEGSDFSSVIHEGGHFLLEELKRGALSDGIDTELWETMKDELGIGDDNIISREQHETAARLFEAYLREGKAPSLSLQHVFDQFKKWLLAIYRSIKGLNVNLTDKVRSIFDQMLATEQEIKEAKQQSMMVAMFDKAFDASRVTPAEAEEYANLVGRSTDEAARQVNRHKLKGNDKRQALWKRSAEAESYKQPLYRALYFLSRGAFPDIKLTRVATESVHNSLGLATENEAQVLLDSTSEKLVIDGHQANATISNAPEWFQEMNRHEGRARIDIKTAANALKQFAAGKPFRSKVGQDVIDAYLESIIPQMSAMARNIAVSELEVGDAFTVMREGEVVEGQVVSAAEGEGSLQIKIGSTAETVAMTGEIEDVVAIYRKINDVIELAENITAGKAGKGLGLDPVLFKDRYGEDLYNQMPKYPGLWKDGGLGLDQAAHEAGYKTTADFVDDLKTYQDKPRARWVEERVAERQVEHDQEFKAEDAIRNELQRRMLEIESKWLSKQADQGKKAMSKKALRRWAEERTAKMTIKDATDVYRLVQASRRLRTQAIAAQRRGDSNKAFDLNEQVRMNEELIFIHVKTREKLAKMTRAWSRMVDAKMENSYRQQVYGLLSKYQLTTKDMVNRGAFTFAEGEEVQTLGSFMDSLLAKADEFDGAPAFSDWILDGKKTGAFRQNLAWGELEELNDMLAYLVGRGREEFLGLLSDKKTRLADVVGEVVAPSGTLKRRKKTYTEGSVMRWITDRTRRYFAQTDMLMFIFRKMDGFSGVGKKGVAGPNERLLWHRLAAARDMRDELAGGLHAQLDDKIKVLIDNAKHDKDLSRLPLPAVYRNAGKVWTWERVIALALNMGNTQNASRVMEGLTMAGEDLHTILSILTKADWQSIQGIWNTIDSLFPKIDQVHFNLNNFHVKKVQADGFDIKTVDGHTVHLDGGYYPLKYDSDLSDMVSAWNEKDDILNSQEAIFQTPAAKSGFVRTRAASAGGLVPKLSMTVLTEHINDSLQYIAFAETVKDLDRITQSADYKLAARGGTGDSGILGNQAYRMIRPALSYAIRPTPEFSANMDKWLDRERVRATAFILAWNVGVAAKQVFSVPGIWFDIGIGNYIKGVARVSTSPLESLKAMHELSTFMRNRSKSLDRDLMDSLKSLKAGRQFKGYSLDDVRNAGFILIKTMDFLAVYPSWWGAYDQAMKQHGGDIDAAVRQANEKIRASQPSGTPIDLSAFQRQKGIMRLFTLFATFVMKYGNRQRESYNAWKAGALPTHQYLWHVWLEAVMPPLLMTTAFSAIQTGEPPEPEELARDVLLYQFVGLPLWRDIIGLFAGSFVRGKISSPVFTGIEIVGETAGNLVKAVDEGDEAAVMRLAWSLAELTSFYSGVPVSRVYEKIMKGVEAMESGEGTPLNLFIPPIEK